jgi:hypothetical protein
MTSLIYFGNIRAKIGYQLLAVGISAFLVNVLTLPVSDYKVSPLLEEEYTNSHPDYKIEA